MFVRQKKNKSGLVSVQIIDKSHGCYKVYKTIGSAKPGPQLQELLQQAARFLQQQTGSRQLDFDGHDGLVSQLVSSIEELRLAGIELLLGKIFEQIGFSAITDQLFRPLVLYRLVFAVSKLKTTEYLARYCGLYFSEDQVYRYLDKLHNQQKAQVQQISYRHSVNVLGQPPRLVFYDVTTLYFEIEGSDELRRPGFSKDGKHQNPQIVLGLLVSEQGYPLAYDIFEGNRFEGTTMLPVIDGFKARYDLSGLVIVADAGLLSKANIAQLKAGGYRFILGARIKNESAHWQQQILQKSYRSGEVRSFDYQQQDGGDGIRLIVAYSKARAAKDKANRQRGLERLEKQVKTGKLSKDHLNQKGYNKYLSLKGQAEVSIDYKRFHADNCWDGLKGYLTNVEGLSAQEVIAHYGQLWQIERAFRIAKTDLKLRPIYHRLQRRIEAHICLSFAAYKVYKELERQLHLKQATISAAKAIEIASSIYALTIKMPASEERKTVTLIKTDEQKMLQQLFGF